MTHFDRFIARNKLVNHLYFIWFSFNWVVVADCLKKWNVLHYNWSKRWNYDAIWFVYMNDCIGGSWSSPNKTATDRGRERKRESERMIWRTECNKFRVKQHSTEEKERIQKRGKNQPVARTLTISKHTHAIIYFLNSEKTHINVCLAGAFFALSSKRAQCCSCIPAQTHKKCNLSE